MKSPVRPTSSLNQTLSAAGDDAVQRTRIMVEQFPTPTGPAAAMVFVGAAVLAATAAMFFLAGPRQEPTASDVSERTPVPVEERQITSADRNAEAGDGTAPGLELASAGQPMIAAAEEAQSAVRADRVVEGSEVLQPTLPTERQIASVLAAPDLASDDASTVAVAETTEELLALEEIQRREVEADLAATSPETTAAVRREPTPKVAATATTWVNMRAEPSDDAEVLMVVPGNAEIQAEGGCNWCAVSYDGREGYIYKTFINYQ